MPSSTSEDLVDLALELGRDLPYDDVLRIASAARAGDAALRQLRGRVGSGRVRDALTRLLEWPDQLMFAAGALQTSAEAVRKGEDRRLDVVWTGPHSSVSTARLTSSVLAELLSQAREEVLLIGYAVHGAVDVSAALHDAASRGVAITLLLERVADNPQFAQSVEAFASVPARRLCWPAHERPSFASLHAKVLVVDRSATYVGSANITGAALERNLECGLLLSGGPHGHRICEHVESLLSLGVLQPVT